MTAKPLKYPGGKQYLAPWIIANMPPHLHYVEPFCGSCAVLFARNPRNVSEVINDVDENLMAFYKVLRDKSLRNDFIEACQLTQFSESEFNAARCIIAQPQLHTELTRAYAFFVINRMSRCGNMESFASLTRNRLRNHRNEQVNAWMSAVEGLEDAANRLLNVAILCGNWYDCIRSQDGPNTFFYVDPPYYGLNHYRVKFSEKEHRELLRVLCAVRGKVMISGYRNELYAEILQDWRCEDAVIPNHMSAGSVKDDETETIWMNY